jgi:hypothetical protein
MGATASERSRTSATTPPTATPIGIANRQMNPKTCVVEYETPVLALSLSPPKANVSTRAARMPTNAPASRKTVYRGLRRTCAVSMRRSAEGSSLDVPPASAAGDGVCHVVAVICGYDGIRIAGSRRLDEPDARRGRTVIVGGGFAGISAAQPCGTPTCG